MIFEYQLTFDVISDKQEKVSLQCKLVLSKLEYIFNCAFQ